MEGDVLALGCSPWLGLCHISTTGWTPAQPLFSMEKGGGRQPGRAAGNLMGRKQRVGKRKDIAGLGYGSRTQGDTGVGWVKDKLGGSLKVLKCQPEECRPGPGCSTEPGSASRQHGWMESLGRTNQPTICIQRWYRRILSITCSAHKERTRP